VDNARVHVYLPTTLTGLASALDAGTVGPAPLDGFAITPGLRAALPGEDDEELEYAAQTRAADVALVRLAASPGAPHRRVVVAVEVEPGDLDDVDGLETGAVVLRAEGPLARVVSALVDDVAAEPLLGRLLVDPDDADAATDLEDHQLLWYAAQELDELVAG
jgi:hypothetical protein